MDKATRLKRLYFRSSHRGSKETDIILEPYASTHLESMSDAELDEFESFLAENDTDIWDWVTGKSLPENDRYAILLRQLRDRYK